MRGTRNNEEQTIIIVVLILVMATVIIPKRMRWAGHVACMRLSHTGFPAVIRYKEDTEDLNVGKIISK